MTKKQRIDTATGAVNTLQAAAKKILPPAHCNVPPEALPFWHSIIENRAAERWNGADLETAAELARAKAHVERLNEQLRVEGDIIVNARGTQIVNPLHSLLETLTRRVVALSRMLQVHAEATNGKSRDQAKATDASQKARQLVGRIEADDLIGRPH